MRISLDHLCKSFDGVEVLRDITFDEEVSALAIIGPSAPPWASSFKTVACSTT